MSKFSRVSLLLIVLFVLTCPSAPGVKADIYRWIDAKGILSFKEQPWMVVISRELFLSTPT